MNKKQRLKFIYDQLNDAYNAIINLGYEVVGVFLQGSQNYNLDIYEKDYYSDVDVKCIVIPKLKDLICGNHMISKTIQLQGNNQADIKDVRLMMEMWRKQNQSYLEILFTDYKIINPKYQQYVDSILNMGQEIADMNWPVLMSCIRGMSKEKVENLKTERPSSLDKIKKYKYDPKQLASIIRLEHLSENIFIHKQSFKDAMVYKTKASRNFMLDIKKGAKSLAEAEDMAKQYDDKINTLKDVILMEFSKGRFNQGTYDKLQQYVYDMVEYGIKSEINNANVNNFNALCSQMTYFTKEEQQNEEKVISKMTTENKENFLDYYK